MNNQSNNIRNQLLKTGLIKSGSQTAVTRSHAPRLTTDAVTHKDKNAEAAKRALAILAASIHR